MSESSDCVREWISRVNKKIVQNKLIITNSNTFSVQTQCPDSGVPDDGDRRPPPEADGRYAVGTKLHHTCNPGRNLKGSRVRTCLVTGKWSGQPATCTGVKEMVFVTLFFTSLDLKVSFCMKYS